jgi:branched-chain amino acid transport system substrate-binding protein
MKKLIYIFLPMLFLMGCGNPKDNSIKIGGTLPLTGEVASYGISAKNGLQLKIDEINTSGGINGKKIEVDFQDDKNSIKDAVNIFNDFATIKKYSLVFGSAGSSVSLSLVPIANREKVILFSPVSSASKLSTEGGQFFFRTVPSDNLQAEMLASWIKQEGIKKIAIVYTNNSWGKPLTDAVTDMFAKDGGEIVFSEGVQENTSDFRTIIIKLKKTKFDAILSPTYPREGGLFVKQLKEAGVVTRLFGGDNWGAPEFISIAGNAANGVCFTFPSDSKSPLWSDFVGNYKKKYGQEPDIIAAYGYDAATAVVEAFKKSSELTSNEIREKLLTVSFEGVSGKISFKPNGDVVSVGYGKRKIDNGKNISIN